MCKVFSEMFKAAKSAAALVVIGVAVLGLSFPLRGQMPAPAPVVKLISVQSRPAAAGHFRLLLRFQVAPGFHVNSHHPNSSYLIPTTVKLASARRLLKQTWPPAQQKKLSFSRKPLAVYSGAFPLRLLVRASRGSTLRGELDYQACNDRLCEPPARLNFQAKVK